MKEIKYISHVLFDEFLGIEYKLAYNDEHYYKIILENKNELIINNGFFRDFKNSTSYLRAEHIPVKLSFLKTDLTNHSKIPVIYGNNSLSVSGNLIICGIDIFASAFFMLSRWEEYVLSDRDEHNRFPGNASLAYKNGFLERPVVNEYTELLWKMLEYLGFEGRRKQRRFSTIPTHDIDELLFWNQRNRANLLKNLSGDILKRRSLRTALKRYGSYQRSLNETSADPINVYDYFMDLAEKVNTKASFYFIPGGGTIYDNLYDISSSDFKIIVKNIKRREHKIGIHPSYDTYNNEKLFSKELKSLEEHTFSDIKTGRQHYLRFQNPITWRLWNDNGLKKDSTLYYSDFPGFRCGTCYEFPVFDIMSRTQLELFETPLIAMDVCFMKRPMYEAEVLLDKLKSQVIKYNGQFVFLWHNSNVSWMHSEKYRAFFEHHFYGN